MYLICRTIELSDYRTVGLILKRGGERFLCGFLKHIHVLKYFRQINFQDIFFREFKEKMSEYIA
jgi:hypothetical protein